MHSSHGAPSRPHFPAVDFAPSSARAGAIINGRYRFDREIARTEAGAIYDATDRIANKRVAIEIASNLRDPSARRRWARDAMIAQRLEGEHVLRVLDVGNLENQVPYAVRESSLCTLASEIAARGPLPVADAVAWTLEACEAVAEAHAIGMAHGDLRLENVCLARGPDAPIVKVGWTSAAKAERAAREDVARDVAGLGTMLKVLATGNLNDEADGAPTLPTELTHAVARATAIGTPDAFRDVAELARAIAPFAPPGHRSAEAIAFLMSRSGLASAGMPRAPESPDEAGVYTAMADDRDRASVSDAWFGRDPRPSVVDQASPARGWTFAVVSLALVGAVLGGSLFLWRSGSLPQWSGSAPPEDVATTRVTSAAAEAAETTPSPAVVDPPAPAAPAATMATPVEALPNAEPALATAQGVDTGASQRAADRTAAVPRAVDTAIPRTPRTPSGSTPRSVATVAPAVTAEPVPSEPSAPSTAMPDPATPSTPGAPAAPSSGSTTASPEPSSTGSGSEQP